MTEIRHDVDDLRPMVRRVRLLCLDVDGVLTDGTMYYNADGEALKRFHTRDAAGIALINKRGIETAWLTAENSPITAARAKKLRIPHVVLGCKDKLAAADDLRRALGLEWLQLAYMGDDWFDIPLLQRVGLSACPRDAHPQVRNVVRFRSRFRGGNGAGRELCDLLLNMQKPDDPPRSSDESLCVRDGN